MRQNRLIDKSKDKILTRKSNHRQNTIRSERGNYIEEGCTVEMKTQLF